MSYLERLNNLDSKVVAIYGGGGHICSKLAEGFLKAGSYVVLLDIRNKNLNNVKKNFLEKKLYNFKTLKVDSTKKNDHVKSLKYCLSNYKKVDVLINGSGINSSIDFFKITEKNWDEVVKSQITSTFLACQIYGKYMTSKKNGSIINISSASSGPPLSRAFAYSASKSAIKNLTQNLAGEFARFNVRVNALRPGFYPTKWNLKNFIDSKRKKQILNHTPMNRFGKTEELIGATLWLAGDSSSFVTGAEIPVDGGFSAITI